METKNYLNQITKTLDKLFGAGFNTEKKINSYIRKLHELGVDVHVDTSLLKT